IAYSHRRATRSQSVIRVNPHRASTEFGGNRVRLTNVPCPDTRCQTVVRIIGLTDQIVQILEGHGRHYRSEDLFAYYGHGRGGIDQHSRLKEVATVAIALATAEGFRPLL